MSAQVRTDPRFAGRLDSRWGFVVVLERLARGGGSTNWYFARTTTDLLDVVHRLRGGSCVTFYFDGGLNVQLDDETARQKMFDAVTPSREIAIGYPEEGNVLLEIELVTGSTELSELLEWHAEGHLVAWGPWPSRAADFGTITIDLVDSDGIQRAHPH
jgi:hypothetical protein